MSFEDKLNFLMTVMNITNHALAQAVHVDSSLISRWRTGDRKPAKKSHYINDISSYFAKIATEGYQKNSICAGMGIPNDKIPAKSSEFAKLIYLWLCEKPQDVPSGDNAAYTVDNFLKQLNVWGKKDSVDPDLNGSQFLEGTLYYSEVFYGIDGIRNALLKLLNMTLASGSKHSAIVFSDQSLSLFNDDPDFSAECQQLIQLCLKKNLKLKIIHTSSRDLREMFTTIERLLPLHITRKIESFYYPDHYENIFKRTMIVVSDVGAIVSNSVDGMQDKAEYFLNLNKATIDYMYNICSKLLSISQPLIQVFTPKTVKQFHKFQREFSLQKGSNISILHTFSSVTMPRPLFVKSFNRLEISSVNYENAIDLFDDKSDIFFNNLKKYSYTELIMLPQPVQLPYTQLPLNLSPFLGKQPIYYDIEDYKEHIRNIIKILETYENYNIFFYLQKDLNNIQVMAKEDVGVIFTKEFDPYLTCTLTQPNMTQAFYNYLDSIAQSIPKQERNKKYVIEQFNRYLDVLSR